MFVATHPRRPPARPALIVAALLAGLCACSAAKRPAAGPRPPAARIVRPELPLRLAPKAEGEAAFTLELEGLAGREWRVESCNPVMPVIDGLRIPSRVCITNFWRPLEVDPRGRAKLEFGWPLGSAELPLIPGGRYALSVEIAGDCEGAVRPGNMGDCKTRRELRTPEFTVAR